MVNFTKLSTSSIKYRIYDSNCVNIIYTKKSNRNDL